MIVKNPFCETCEGRECWRSICRVCGGYTAIHVPTRGHAEGMSDLHHCRPLSIPASQFDATYYYTPPRRRLP